MYYKFCFINNKHCTVCCY